jgi:hypothetical protein
MRLPSTLPTMTAPSSYTMQMRWPSLFQAMPRTTLLFRLLIISSYHDPFNKVSKVKKVKPLQCDAA